MKRNIILTACLALSAMTPCAAQELKENINVEGIYKPDIIRQERLNTFPTAPRITFETFDMKYDEDGKATPFAETLQPMPATLWGAERSTGDNRGYVVAGAGSYLSSTLSAGYRIISDKNTTAGIRLQWNSSSLFKPYEDGACAGNYRRRYDGTLGAYFAHRFEGAGRLDASLDYSIGRFNYYGYNPQRIIGATQEFPWQTLNRADFKASWMSEIRSDVEWGAEAGVKYTGFNSLWIPESDRSAFARYPGQRETDLRLGAMVRKIFDSGSRIGIDAQLDYLVYSGVAHKSDILVETVSPISKCDDYGVLALNPYYGFSRGLLNVRLGAAVDLSFNAGPRGSRYSFFHIAPDVRFDWRKGGAGLYLHLLGGSELQTLDRLQATDYYCMPALSSTRPVYSPIDATAGATFGPFSGFSAAISASYKISNRVPLGGLYSYYLTEAMTRIGYPYAAPITNSILTDKNFETIKGWSLGAELKYSPGEIFSITAKGTYQNQNKGKGYFNGYDRARWTFDAAIDVKPVSALTISVGYRLRAVRKVDYLYMANLSDEGDIRRISLPDFQTLNASATYALTKNFSLWLSADNLTCRRNMLLPSLPTEKITVLGGLSVKF